jgi:hypothetical protein
MPSAFGVRDGATKFRRDRRKASKESPPVQRNIPKIMRTTPRSGPCVSATAFFGPVTADVWEFEVSGLKVVQSWLGYRMKKRAGKKSSPLDEIRPGRWTPRMTDEFLELLWVVEATLAMEPELAVALDKVVSGACFTAAELPTPSAEERKAPGAAGAAGGLLALLGGRRST